MGVRAEDWGVTYVETDIMFDVLECYWAWDHPYLTFLDEDCFWDGLTRQGSEFCSRLLVHSILAYGSVSLCPTHTSFRELY